MAVQSHKKRIIILLIVIVGLLSLIGFAAYKFSQSGQESSTAQTEVVQKAQPTETLAGLIAGNKDLSTFEEYLKDTAQFSQLDGAQPFTIIAFTNSAFKQAPEAVKGIFEDSAKTSNQKTIISYHVISGDVPADSLSAGQKIKTSYGSEVVVKKEGNDIYITDMKGNDAHVVKAGIAAKNGSLYIIDDILLPQ